MQKKGPARRLAAGRTLQYLVLFNGLASRKDDGGIRWFTALDDLYPTEDEVARGATKTIRSSCRPPARQILVLSHDPT